MRDSEQKTESMDEQPHKHLSDKELLIEADLLEDRYEDLVKRFKAGEEVDELFYQLGEVANNIARTAYNMCCTPNPPDDELATSLDISLEFITKHCIRSMLWSNGPFRWGGLFDAEFVSKLRKNLITAELYRPYSSLPSTLLMHDQHPLEPLWDAVDAINILGLDQLPKVSRKTKFYPLGDLLLAQGEQHHKEKEFDKAAVIYELLAKSLGRAKPKNPDKEISIEYRQDEIIRGISAVVSSLVNMKAANSGQLETLEFEFLGITDIQPDKRDNETLLMARTALHRLSEYYRHGMGVERDFEKAARYRKLWIEIFKSSYFDTASQWITDKTELGKTIQPYQGVLNIIFSGTTRYDLSLWFRAAGEPPWNIEDDTEYAEVRQLLHQEFLFDELLFDELISAQSIDERAPVYWDKKEHMNVFRNDFSYNDYYGEYPDSYYEKLVEAGDINAAIELSQRKLHRINSASFMVGYTDENGKRIKKEERTDDSNDPFTDIRLNDDKEIQKREKQLQSIRDLLMVAVGMDQHQYNYPPPPKAALLLGKIADDTYLGNLMRITNEYQQTIRDNQQEALKWWNYLLKKETYPATDENQSIIGEAAGLMVEKTNKAVEEANKTIEKSEKSRKSAEEENLKLEQTLKTREEQHATEKALAVRNKEHEIYGSITHTLGNARAIVPEILRDTTEALDDLLDGEIPDELVGNLGTLSSIFDHQNTLVTLFKQIVADEGNLNQQWNRDTQGSAHIRWLIALSLQQVLTQILFSDSHYDIYKKSFNEEIEKIQHDYLHHVMTANLTPERYQLLFDWVDTHFSSLNIEIDESGEHYHFSNSSTRFGVLFSTFSELIMNGLKYWDGKGPLQIRWRQFEQVHQFSVTNATDPANQQGLDSTRKGLDAIHAILDKLDNASLKSDMVDSSRYRSIITLS